MPKKIHYFLKVVSYYWSNVENSITRVLENCGITDLRGFFLEWNGWENMQIKILVKNVNFLHEYKFNYLLPKNKGGVPKSVTIYVSEGIFFSWH